MTQHAFIPLHRAVWRYCTIHVVVEAEKIFLSHPISDLLNETEQSAPHLSRLCLVDGDQLNFLLRGDPPVETSEVQLDLFQNTLDLHDLASAIGVSKEIAQSAMDDLGRLKRRIEATFVCSVEAGRCEIRARKKFGGPLHTIPWSEFKFFRITNWQHGLAEGPSGSTLFDIEVGEITTPDEFADPPFASIIRFYRSSRPDVRALIIEILEHRSTPLGKGTGPVAKVLRPWLKTNVHRNTFATVRDFLDAKVLNRMPDEQRTLLEVLKNLP